jgi:surfactin synthase thioesterase subunit/aryl carrier-like protein
MALGLEEISVTDNLLELGLDSLGIIRIVSEMAGAGMETRAEDFFVFPTIRQLAANARTQKRGLIHVFNPGPAERALLAIPYGGGSYGVFFPLATHLRLRENIPIVAVQSASVDPLALLAELKQLPYRNYSILTCCLGSTLGIEMSHLLTENGFNVTALFLAASAPPKAHRLYGRFINPWRFTGDDFINRYLQKLSERKFHLGKGELRQFRLDADYFFKYLAKKGRPAPCPVHALYGGADPMFFGVDVRRRWERYFGHEVADYVLVGTRHYFTQIYPDKTATYILSHLRS